jgi:aminoglycoside N3'-acetyltransferase
MLTQRSIEEKLRELGLRENQYVEVHSSLSSFGPVEGGAATVIAALQGIVTEGGAIVMTSFPVTGRLELTDEDRELGVACKIRLLHPDSDERTGMGVISDTFRRMPGVRTGEGPHRVSAWGAEVEENMKGLGNLHRRDGYALLLGVDIYSLTSMHYVEDRLPARIAEIFRPTAEALKRYPPDRWYIECGVPPVKAWYKIQDAAYGKGYIRDILIGRAACMFFKVNDVIGLYRDEIEADALGLYGIID